MVLGSYTLLPGSGKNRLRLDIRLQDTAAGEHRGGRAYRQRAGFVRTGISGWRSPSSESGRDFNFAGELESVRASLPATQQAFRLYTEGQSKLWAFDFVPARDLLVQATTADPGYPLVHSALSEVWNHLGYAAKAREEAQRALELSGPLSEENRLLNEGHYRGNISDWPKSIEAYKKLFSPFPDNLNYGPRLAPLNFMSVRKTRYVPWPRCAVCLLLLATTHIDLGEASVLASRDPTKARGAAEHAAEKGTAQGLTFW